jgi:dihydrolipoamide dehydrogenase
VDSSIKFNVSANTAQFQSGMRQVDTVAKSTAAGIKQAFSGVGSMLIGGAAVAGLKSLMNDFDKIAKVATRFGASAEDLARSMHAHPTLAEIIKEAALAVDKRAIHG